MSFVLFHMCCPLPICDIFWSCDCVGRYHITSRYHSGRAVSDREKMLITGKNYGTLLAEQKMIDVEIETEVDSEKPQIMNFN